MIIRLDENYDFDGLVETIRKKSEEKRIIVAIEGRSATGKTYLAKRLQNAVEGVEVFHADDFFLPPETRTPARLAEIGGNIDRERLLSLLKDLEKSEVVHYGKFDCKTLKTQEITSQVGKINVVEGCYCTHPILRGFYDVILYLSVPDELREKRLVKRVKDEQILRKYFEIWIPLEERFFKEYYD